MSKSAIVSPQAPPRSGGWFVWNAGLWLVFFTLLYTQHLEDVADKIGALPLPVEVLVWIIFFPWVLATAVWTSGWWDDLRITFVALLAIVWTLISIPRTKTPTRAGRRPAH
ncbi:hypothetical protein E1263_31300 [Kribbella antibiotica]|uniref:Uncharacterized protein n=1 Tax=Kribbella antibiotica TaxID=190195 RepID=A0A4V2YMC3_9ACTN|nr:hypothetical protein [Kribbella antibiotica]TDD50057.1 hypothetical protein E1263_31300 [Kribbella antibiotica]